MDKLSLAAIAREHSHRATRGGSGPAATTGYRRPDRSLRKTVITLEDVAVRLTVVEP